MYRNANTTSRKSYISRRRWAFLPSNAPMSTLQVRKATQLYWPWVCFQILIIINLISRGDFNTIAAIKLELRRQVVKRQMIPDHVEVHDVCCRFCSMKPITGNLYRCLVCEQVSYYKRFALPFIICIITVFWKREWASENTFSNTNYSFFKKPYYLWST